MTAIAAHAADSIKITSLDGTQITARVFKPDAPKGTVVALHGCGGLYSTRNEGELTARHQGMADMLVGEGYAVVFPDSLTPRGVKELCTQRSAERSVTQAERRADALATIAWVAQQPWAAPQKIALIGWSHGGSGVLSTTDITKDLVAAQAVKPAAAIAFYPGCMDALKEGYKPDTRLVMMLGELDDWTQPGPCIQLGRRAGAEVNVYPGAYHDFDNPVGSVRVRTDVPRNGGVHAGANPEAREAAYKRVREVLKESLP